MKPKPGNMEHEADIGSGEKSQGQQETEEMIQQLGNGPGQNNPGSSSPAQADRQPPGSGAGKS